MEHERPDGSADRSLEQLNHVFTQWSFFARAQFDTLMAFNRTMTALVSGALIATLSMHHLLGSQGHGWLLSSWIVMAIDVVFLVVGLLLSERYQEGTADSYLHFYVQSLGMNSVAVDSSGRKTSVQELRNETSRLGRNISLLNWVSVALFLLALVLFGTFVVQNWSMKEENGRQRIQTGRQNSLQTPLRD